MTLPEALQSVTKTCTDQGLADVLGVKSFPKIRSCGKKGFALWQLSQRTKIRIGMIEIVFVCHKSPLGQEGLVFSAPSLYSTDQSLL